jgi:hypothetical protein
MNKFKGSVALFVFLAPFIFGLGSIIFEILKAIVDNIETVFWISGVSIIFILWVLVSNYGLKYLHSIPEKKND